MVSSFKQFLVTCLLIWKQNYYLPKNQFRILLTGGFSQDLIFRETDGHSAFSLSPQHSQITNHETEKAVYMLIPFSEASQIKDCLYIGSIFLYRYTWQEIKYTHLPRARWYFCSQPIVGCGELSPGKLGKPALPVTYFVIHVLKCTGWCFSRQPGSLEEWQILSFASSWVEIKNGAGWQQVKGMKMFL